MTTADVNPSIYPSIEPVVIFSVALLLGMAIGWFIVIRKQQKIEYRLLDELVGLRTNFNYVREDAHVLRVQLREAEAQNLRLARLLKSTSGHDKFLKARTELETARKGIQALKSLLAQSEREKFALKEQIYKQQHKKASSQVHPIPLHVKKLPVLHDGQDDLRLISGINASIDRKLRSLGIISYRQLAECSPTQLNSIQRLVGQNRELPLRQWVKAARELFIRKYNYSENDTGVFGENPSVANIRQVLVGRSVSTNK